MNVFVVLVLVAAVVVAGLLALALTGRTGFARPLAEPVRTLPPVLLPDRPEPQDVERLRFSPALHGYRMDQVDETLDRLAAALAQRDAEIAALRAGGEPGAGAGRGVISGTARNPR
ncbi:MAG TPA: DivIVA domain-containing protein [Citricoccus sp.]